MRKRERRALSEMGAGYVPCEVTGRYLSFKLESDAFDDGREFDPMTAPSPNHALEGQRPRPGGLGIHMIKELVDHFTYERIDGRNHTTLSKTCEVGRAIQR